MDTSRVQRLFRCNIWASLMAILVLRRSDEGHVSCVGNDVHRSNRRFFFVDAVYEFGFHSLAPSSFRSLLLLPFSCSSTCLMYIPSARNCAPFLDIARRSLSPASSMNEMLFRSTVHVRPSWLRCAFFQHVLSSPTHGPTNWPCKIHRFSVGVSLIVIFNTFTSPARLADSPASRLQRGRAWHCLPNC